MNVHIKRFGSIGFLEVQQHDTACRGALLVEGLIPHCTHSSPLPELRTASISNYNEPFNDDLS